MSLRLSSSTRQKFCPLDKLHTSVPYPILGHPVELLRERVLVGSATECIEKLANLQAAGVRKVFLWPMTLRSWRSSRRIFFLSYHSSLPAGDAGFGPFGLDSYSDFLFQPWTSPIPVHVAHVNPNEHSRVSLQGTPFRASSYPRSKCTLTRGGR